MFLKVKVFQSQGNFPNEHEHMNYQSWFNFLSNCCLVTQNVACEQALREAPARRLLRKMQIISCKRRVIQLKFFGIQPSYKIDSVFWLNFFLFRWVKQLVHKTS